MSSRLTVSETIDLLDRLKATLRDCAATEEKLNRTFEASAASAQKRFKDQIEARERELAQELRLRETELLTRREKLGISYQRRTAQISKAHKSAKRKADRWVIDEEGRRKAPLQRGVLEAQRSQTEGLKENDRTLAEFQAQHGAVADALNNRVMQAHKTFRGYSAFRRMLEQPRTAAEPLADEHQALQQIRELDGRAARDLESYRRLFLPKIFRNVPLAWWIVLLVLAAGALPLAKQLGFPTIPGDRLGIASLGLLVVMIAIHIGSKVRARPLARRVADALNEARQLQEVALRSAEERHAQQRAHIETTTNHRIHQLESEWRTAEQDAIEARDTLPRKLDEKSWRLSVKADQVYHDNLELLERGHRGAAERLNSEFAAWKQELTTAHQAKLNELKTTRDSGRGVVTQKLDTELRNARETLQAARTTAERDFPDWNSSIWENWRPPEAFETAARFGRLEVGLQDQTEVAPLVLRCPQEASVVLETSSSDHATAVGALNGLILRLLSTSPPGKASFTIIDPVKLGQNFAAIMHLADYGEGLINGRIWTEPPQIEERLAELNAHMEKVIQNYLRNEYANIAEYNRQAGTIAEKYHFLVVADFPANFSEAALRRLLRIAGSGARCGVFMLIHWDRRHVTPHEALLEDIRKHSICLNHSGGQWMLMQPTLEGAHLTLDPAPDPQFTTTFLHQVGAAHRGATRVELPFSVVAPANPELWIGSTREELQVPIGRSGAAKAQTLAIGKGTRQHALIAGKTGSGKSTLFHAIITNLALWCSPDEVEFYLVDFKKGVEFKCYGTHRLPHAKVVAIESDREFGLSVLQRVDEELRLRGELFRKSGVLDVAGYRAANPDQPLPRCLLIIDEFQEFFVEDDRIAQTANVLLDRIVRQGRAFGIHVLLGSQTLGGAYTLARATLGQMVVRIALQCNEADAYLIMDESNPAPRLLSRPGEGIYNDSAGAIEANSPFQAVWLPDDERDLWLKRVRTLADQRNFAQAVPIVFEGNAPADVQENTSLRAVLEAENIQSTSAPRMWLGAPNSIKGATEAVFHRRSGSNVLVVGQNDEAISSMVTLGAVALSAQHPFGRCYVCGTLPIASMPGVAYAEGQEALRVISELTKDLQQRSATPDPSAPPIFLFIHGLHNFRKLRQEDEFALSGQGDDPAMQLRSLITDGPGVGIHVIATIDHYNNVTRFLGRKTLSEFSMRVLFQMSGNDSASLCDDPRASTLGLHRALFYHEPEGRLETFRPYAPPSADWMAQAVRQLGRLRGRADVRVPA